ncbi:hypothetical protein Bbelb_319690 [Branchiostoma belcheri]|nr:hypothetical protein Bbelb_319690 [Branchiostoma belcheri]
MRGLPKPGSANYLLCTTASIPEVLQNSQPNKPKKRRASTVGAGSAAARPGSAQGRGRRRITAMAECSAQNQEGPGSSPDMPPIGKRRKKSTDEGPPSSSLDTTTKNIVPSSPEATDLPSKGHADDKDDSVEKAPTDDCVKTHKPEKEVEKPSTKSSAPTAVEEKDKTVSTRDNSGEVEPIGDKMEVVDHDTQDRRVALPKDKSTASVVETENTTAGKTGKTVASASDTSDKASVASSGDEDSQEPKEKLLEPSKSTEEDVAKTLPEEDEVSLPDSSKDTREDAKTQSATSEEKATDKPKVQPPVSSPVEEYDDPRTPPTPTQDEQFEYEPLNTETAYSIPIVALQSSAAETSDAAGPSSKEEEPREYSEDAKSKRSDSPASQSSSRSRGKEDDQKGDRKRGGKTSTETRDRGVEAQSIQKSTPSESSQRQASETRGGKREDGSRRGKRARTPSPPRGYRRSPSSPRRRRSPSPGLGRGGREVKGGRSRRNSSPQGRRSTRRSVDEEASVSKRPRRM